MRGSFLLFDYTIAFVLVYQKMNSLLI